MLDQDLYGNSFLCSQASMAPDEVLDLEPIVCAGAMGHDELLAEYRSAKRGPDADPDYAAQLCDEIGSRDPTRECLHGSLVKQLPITTHVRQPEDTDRPRVLDDDEMELGETFGFDKLGVPERGGRYACSVPKSEWYQQRDACATAEFMKDILPTSDSFSFSTGEEKSRDVDACARRQLHLRRDPQAWSYDEGGTPSWSGSADPTCHGPTALSGPPIADLERLPKE